MLRSEVFQWGQGNFLGVAGGTSEVKGAAASAKVTKL
jgi:hypothetical protein